MIDHLTKEVGEIIKIPREKELAISHLKSIEKFFERSPFTYDDFQTFELTRISKRYLELLKWKSYKTKLINSLKEELLMLLSKSVERNSLAENKYLRKLRNDAVIEKNVISVFESSLTRMLGIETDELSTDIMVVKTYYFDVMQDLILNGFEYDGEKYMFLTASAGQIRTKKTVFIKERLWKQHERALMCGLTMDEINAKGGINVNKYLAYLALSNSATDLWDGFDIDRCIVVPDFETAVNGTVDFIDDKTYQVMRRNMDVPIEHTDGCGMILPSLSKKNFMVRLPWVKGLLASFDFKKFIEVHGCKPVVKDIYGQEHDVIDEDIQIIFTKSQFKMWKYYDSWKQYKDCFKKYGCQAGTCKVEEDRIRMANINYQMLQTLTNITDAEIQKIAMPAITKIQRLSTDVESMLEAFGAVKGRENLNSFQEALLLYPEMLSDGYCKSKLNEIKNSMVKRYHYGKLPVKGKYTFVVPDLYAVCQNLFSHITNPTGLLDNGQVSCHLYQRSEKLDCLRPPHLYREHAIRENLINTEIQRWFQTDAVYTSCHDLISKILQFDNDGDTLLVVADQTIIKVAERNMEGIVPLYYDMKKAEPVLLDNEALYKGMTAAWASGGIGPTSNNVTKIWNRGFVGDNELLAIKLLCCEGNFQIDSAKTLYMPKRPDYINDFLKQYTNCKMPYFFKEAKNYTDAQVTPLNGSLINKLRRLIKKKRLSFKQLPVFSYRKLMNQPNLELTDSELISKYEELSQIYHYRIKVNETGENNASYLIDDIKNQLLDFGHSLVDTTDILIRHLYISDSNAKLVLWTCFGDVILENLKKHINPRESYCKKCGKRFIPKSTAHKYCDSCLPKRFGKPDERFVICKDCGKEFSVPKSVKNKPRCDECQKEHNRKYEREKKRKQREREKERGGNN